jgi:hypothetical protein
MNSRDDEHSRKRALAVPERSFVRDGCPQANWATKSKEMNSQRFRRTKILNE